MQVPKEDIIKKILEVSKQEFVKNGFQQSSMRIIAKEAGVGLSNIYNYFKNKDQIFEKLVQPLLNEFKQLKHQHNAPDQITDQVFYSNSYQERNIKMLVNLVETYRLELDLLFFKSEGSKLANFKEIIIEEYTAMSMEYLQKLNEKYPKLKGNISEFFIHNMAAWWVNILVEIVMHQMNENEYEKFIGEYVQFATAGWQKLLNA